MENQPSALVHILEGMNGWRWMIIGFVLLVVEMLTGSLFLLWPAVAAIFVGLVIFILPLSWEMQLLLFALVSAAGLIWGELYLRPRLKADTAANDLNDRSARMIGQRVLSVSDFHLGQGRVKVGDSEWAAKIEVGDPKAGDELRIIAVSGASVTVERV